MADVNFMGVLIGAATFATIGLFHPLVVKAEYHLGVGCWWIFLLSGVACIAASLFVQGVVLPTLLGVVGFSCLWSILELFKQKQRVAKGWFPANPRRKNK